MAAVTSQTIITSISKRWYTSEKNENAYPRLSNSKSSCADRFKSNCYCSKNRAWTILTSFIPVIKYIRNYRRENAIGDFMSGLTATFLHLPQGLGFGILAGLQPVYGLYTTFFPVMIYLFFGTSPHVSFGSNAVMALLTQTVVQREADNIFYSSVNASAPIYENLSNRSTLSANLLQVKVGAAMTASLLTGLILTAMGILRLGFLTRFMSASFIGGFTTGAAVHIASSQVPKMLGIKVHPHSGPGKLPKMYIVLFSNIEKTVISELVISVITIMILLTVKVLINERYKEKLKVPIPIDFIVIIMGTVMSYFLKFEENFSIQVVGDIPSGFPLPHLPSLESASRMIIECIVMAILSFALTISLAKLTAKEHGNPIDDNQELIAYGICNMGSSFFSCFPQATAPPRTMILSTLGTKTTLHAVPTGIITLFVILWLGTLFKTLPISMLAAMIIVAMKNLLMQFCDLPLLWKINKFDLFTWIFTCLISVFVDLDYGILVGVGFSILSVVIQHQFASSEIFGMLDKEYLSLNDDKRAHIVESSSFKIFQFQSPLYFANAEIFKQLLYKKIANPIKLEKKRQRNCVAENENGPTITGKSDKTENRLKHVILDFQMISHIDLSGINILKQILKEYKAINIKVYIVKCSSKVANSLKIADVNFPQDLLFPDISDAIMQINNQASPPKNDLSVFVTKL